MCYPESFQGYIRSSGAAEAKVANTKEPPKAYPHKHAVSSIALNLILWQSQSESHIYFVSKSQIERRFR
jgi:hypothetical protein